MDGAVPTGFDKEFIMNSYPSLLAPLDLGFTQLKSRVLHMDSCTQVSTRSSS